MRWFKFLIALLTSLKYRIDWANLKYGQWGKIRYIKTIKKYIVFCPHCGEYIDNEGICSNPFCPEPIDEGIYDDPFDKIPDQEITRGGF